MDLFEEYFILNFVRTLVISVTEAYPRSRLQDCESEFIVVSITENFSRVYVHRSDDKFSWITIDDLNKWNITEADLDRQANINADNLLAETRIAVDTIESRKLGLIEAEEASLKGALLFPPSMKGKIEDDFGFPFYAVIPVRDFCYIFSENDFDYFSERLGKVVIDEYSQSGYPITTEILKFTEKGVEAVGQYPIR